MATGLRVLIVEDHRLFAEVLRSTLERLGMEVVASAPDARQGFEAARRERPGLVLVDIGLPDESGLTLGRKILEELPEAKIVALTALNDRTAITEAVLLGFHGYVTKNTQIDKFVSSIQAVMDGHVVLPEQLVRPPARPRTLEERRAEILIRQLTPREREVLTFLAKAAGSEDIATALGLSASTVRTHVRHILIKLGVNSRLKAAVFAIRHGLVHQEGFVSEG